MARAIASFACRYRYALAVVCLRTWSARAPCHVRRVAVAAWLQRMRDEY